MKPVSEIGKISSFQFPPPPWPFSWPDSFNRVSCLSLSFTTITITIMPTCGLPSAISCIPLSGGSYSWLGCYLDDSTATGFSVISGVQLTWFSGSATECITVYSTSNSGTAYNYARIETGSCYCGTSVSSSAPGSSSLCNIFCNDNALCGGYDGTSVYGEAYVYNGGGSAGCPTLSTTTTTSSSTAMSTSTTSSASVITGTSEIDITPHPKTNR